MELTPVLVDPKTRRDQIRARALDGLQQAFPLKVRDLTIELHDPRIHERNYGPDDQKAALLQGNSLHEPIKGTLVLKGPDGKVLETAKNFTLLHLPYFTERHTFVVDGNEYQVSNQLRMKPGVYTRRRANDELEAAFNLSKGSNFRLSLDPQKGHPYIEYGTTTIPLYPILRRLGTQPNEIAQAWGRQVAEANARAFEAKADQAVDKLYGKLVHPSKQTATTPAAKIEAIHRAFETTAMDGEVNYVTLGAAHEKVTPRALLDASRKLLEVYRSGADVDDRDSLAFKTFHSVDDFIKERIQLDARAIAAKVKGRATTKTTLRELVPSAPFSSGVRSFLTGSQLSAIPTQINPMEMIDNAVKVTSLGEGGISSERAIPMEARQLHPTHFGILDPVRTPECVSADTEVLTSTGWKLFRDVTQADKLACNIRGQLEFHHPEHLFARRYVGEMYGVKTGTKAPIEYLVTPNHRVWSRPEYPGAAYRMDLAETMHGRIRWFTGRHDPYAGDARLTTFRLPGAARRSGKHEPAKVFDIRDWAEFVGWYLSEGSFTLTDLPQFQVQLSQFEGANPDCCREIEALLARMQLAYTRSADQRTYIINSRQLTEYVAQFGHCAQKYIPEYLFEAPVAARRALWRALLRGDGRYGVQVRATGKEQYQEVLCTTSERLARDFERLSISLGTPTRTAVYVDKRDDRYLPVYEVRVIQAMEKQARKSKGHYYTVPYDGMVYCAQVPGNMLYIRRNGAMPIWTGNSFKAGVDIRASMLAHRDARGNLYTPVRNVKTGKFEQLSAKDIEQKVVAFPGQRLSGLVAVMKRGQVQHVPAAEVQYELYHSAQLYSPSSNLIPMMESIQGNRATMGSKMQTQALPLVEREAPLVQVGAKRLTQHGSEISSWEKEFAKLILPTAPVSGKVVKVDSQYVYIDPTHTKQAADATRQKRADEVMKKVFFQGVPVHVDRPKGFEHTFRNGAKVIYQYDYGFVPGLFDNDGEELDVYLGEDQDAKDVFIIEKLKDDGKTLDEHKVFLGFPTKDAAVRCFDHHILPRMRSTIHTVTLDAFKRVIEDEGGVKVAEENNLVKVPYETFFPFASKTYLNHDLHVKPGDTVHADQPLGESNFTRGGTLALGRNMTIAYMPYYGLNSNDAVVISEGAATKLTSEHMYKEVLDVDRDTTIGREIHRQYYGSKYQAAQYRKLDDKGVVKKGAKLLPHDPIVVGVQKGKLSSTDALLGNFKKSLANPYREVIRTWDHDFEGEVVDVFQSDRRIVVTVRTREPMRIGDKLAGRYGNKGVVSHIVPDHKMVQDEGGKPVDILYTSAGVISRINPAQIIETAVAKVAQKTGQPIVVENFSGRDNVRWAKDLLAQHGVKDKERVFDPISGKHIDGVLVGPQYTLRLFKTTDSNFSARGTGGYDVNMQPTKGGDAGAKAIGAMEFNALIAHNARNVLKEASSIKSQKNDEFWRAVQLGLPLPPMRSSFAYDKFIGMLHGAGIKVDQQGSALTLKPLTDNDVLKMSSGAVQNEKLVRAKDLAPERGGLFDPSLTGGTAGTRWSHIDLAEPIVNPVFTDPTRRLLGLTNKALDELHYREGGAAIKSRLNQIDVESRLTELRNTIKGLSGAKLDDAVKQIKYLEALKRAGLRPGDAYVLTKLPVLPPVMRPILPGNGGQEMVVGDSNYLYQNAMLHNKVLKAQNDSPILPPDEHAGLRRNLHQAVGAVIGTHTTDNPKLEKRNVKGFLEHLTGKTTPKSSFFQKKLMKKQQDASGRGTIAPDGSLDMDQVGLPEDMLWGMFGKFVIKRLISRGFGAVQAKEMLEKRHPAARDALMAECAERPVMVNRAPTLHRYNVVGAYAVPVQGKTIRVNPFIEKGMNADYDGDTFQVHVPVMPQAVSEVRQMTLSNLIFGDKQHNELMVAPGHEALIGVHLATAKAADGKVHKFKTKADAVAAYKRGEISLQDKVEII